MPQNNRKKFVKVLIANSNEKVQTTLKDLFKKLDYYVACVSTGKEALEALPKYPFHFIIADAELPDMPGKMLLEQIRKINFKINCILMDGVSQKTQQNTGAGTEIKTLSLDKIIAIFSKEA